jgi:hypothetical protein
MMDGFEWIATPTGQDCQYPQKELPHTVSPLHGCLESGQHETKPDLLPVLTLDSHSAASLMVSLATPYVTPVHIAIYKKASLPVLKAIVQADPGVLLQKDGPLGLTPLALSLKLSPQDKWIARFLLETQPLAARIACNQTLDLPLHMACREQADMDVIISLLGSYPSALCHANIHGLIPYDIVQRQLPSSFYSHQLLQLLQKATTAATDDSRDRKSNCEGINHAAITGRGIRTPQCVSFQ